MKRHIQIILASIIPLFFVCTMASAGALIPMTAVTGNPDRSEVTGLLTRYRDVGIDQFLIYPRSGLEIEYMSDEWMRFCRDCIEVADSLGMKVWLYDEYNYPSGNCKGAVTADGHESCYPKLLMFNNDGKGNYSTELTYNHIGADLLDPEAVSRFISLTHQRYYDEFSEYFGRVIPAIFTDEPSFSYSTSSAKGILEADFTSFDKDHFALVWYDGLEKDYFRACGRGLKDDVIAYLHGEPSGELWTVYYSLVGDRMRHVYLESLASWCEGHGIALTGHLMYEKLYKSVRCNGNILKALSVFDIPGFDEANSDIALDAREMEISGLALAQYAGRGKAGEMCELYSVGPADQSMSVMRQLLWMCSCFGIDNYIVAVSATDARGNKEKGDWYFPSGPTQPWYDYYREFGEEASRAAGFARKGYTPDVYVRVPSRYFMSLDKTPAFEGRGVKYLRFLERLLARQIQFMLLDEDEKAPAGKLVLGYGDDGFIIENHDGTFDDLDEYFNEIVRLSPRRLVVADELGNETRDVLVRLWDDDTFTLVDLTDDDRNDRLLKVRLGGREGTVRLLGHDAFAGSMDELPPVSGGPLFVPSFKNARLVPSESNLVRCIHTRDNPEFRFKLRGGLEGLRLIARDWADAPAVTLDGVPVEFTGDADRLPFGFRGLYRSGKCFTLERGRHVIRVENDVTDYRYLPSVFLEGRFAYDRSRRELSRWRGRGKTSSLSGLSDYIGTYEISSSERIPSAKGTVLRIGTNLACTEVLMDGVSLGRKGWGPYEWEIPDAFLGGRHTVTVRISTNIMPMFGDVGFLDEDQPYASWLRIKPGMHGDKSVTGIMP